MKAQMHGIASHYYLTCPSFLKKNDICWIILDYLHKEKLVSKDEVNELEVNSAALELKKLDLKRMRGLEKMHYA